MKKIYICYDSENPNAIMSVCSSKKLAQKICAEWGDSYFPINLNEDYGRKVENTENISVYNINGKFIEGYKNAVDANNKEIL